MPIIRPISDLRNNFTEISRIVHEDNEPVFITKNGTGDMVVLSIEQYNEYMAIIEENNIDSDINKSLRRSEADIAAGRLTSHDEAWKMIDARIEAIRVAKK